MKPLKEKYKKEVVPEMVERFGYKNRMAVPCVERVVVNIGFGRFTTGKTKQEREKLNKEILNDLSLITGQRPILTKARKSISSFKIRIGMPIGAKVTLRGQKMYDFLDRLIQIALPRIGDFRGIEPTSIDREGNLTIGIKEQIVFPEVSAENIKRIFSFEVTIVTDTKKRDEAIELFRLLGFPLKD